MKSRVFLAVLLAACPLGAQTSSIAPAVGTLGFGGSAGVRFGLIGIRAVANTGSYSQDFQKRSIRYNGTLKLNNAGAIVDLYPFRSGSGFRVSGGVYSNRNRVDLISDRTQTIVVNGVAYPAALIGYVTGDVRVNRSSPYAGVGWAKSGKGIGISFDAGALYHGSPKLAVQAHPANPQIVPASFYTNLEAERAKTENDIRDYRYHPVVTIGLTFGF